MTDPEIRPYWYEKEVERLKAKLAVKYREGYDNALAEHPFNRSAVIEECALVAKSYFGGKNELGEAIVAAIRALKDKP